MIKDTYIKGVATGGGGSVGAKLMKTGQTTSYATGDDGDIEAGREVDFFTLASNNPFGNTNRFTDYLGGQSYSIGVLVDWSTYDGSTVLGYSGAYNSNTYNVTWEDCITAANGHSEGSYISGWRMPNIKEYLNVHNFSVSLGLAYSQWFNNSFGGVWARHPQWTSTTSQLSTSSALYVDGRRHQVTAYSKTTSGRVKGGFAVRNFTVTGTTLT